MIKIETLIRKKHLVFLLLGPGSFLIIQSLLTEVDPLVRTVMATTAWMATWWITEAISISATALLPIVIFPIFGVTTVQVVTTTYFSPIVVLYMGGFILAIAIEKWGLHKRIALSIIKLVGSDGKRILLGFMLATFFISMWISNTATTLMVLPIALSIILAVNPVQGENPKFTKSMMLAIAYSASIGGMATLIGSPTNLVFSGLVEQYYGVQVSFSKWILFAFPVSLVMLVVAWRYLAYRASDFQGSQYSRDHIQVEIQKLGAISSGERAILIIFLLAAGSWMSRTFLINPFFPQIDDTVIAVLAALALFIIPVRGKALLSWEDTKELPWGILIVFGGGLALAKGIEGSGMAEWLGTHFQVLNGLPFFLLLLLVILSVNFFTEITSNVATASVVLPILASLSQSFDVHPFGLMLGACLASSCAFMLPVATPPNAIVFGSGYLEMKDMVRTGIWMNLATTLILTLCVYWLLPLIWGFDLFTYPF